MRAVQVGLMVGYVGLLWGLSILRAFGAWEGVWYGVGLGLVLEGCDVGVSEWTRRQARRGKKEET